MKLRYRAILLSIGLGLAVWIIDAALDAQLFYGGAFWDLLILHVPPHELYVRLVILASFVAFGLIVARTNGALRQSQRAFETLVGNLPGMGYRCQNNEKWTMTFVSEGCADLTGYRPADLIDDRAVAYGDLIAPEDRAAVWGAVQAGVESGQPYQMTYRITTAGGQQKWVWEQGEAIRSPGDDGEILLEGFITDITERVCAEEALRASEERSRTTLYSIGDAVITTDNRGRVRQMNPVAETLTGWREAEAVGRPLPEVFHVINEMTRARIASPVERVLKAGATAGLANHTLLIARDGKEYPIADSGAPIRNEGGEITGVVLVFRDQTEERAAERTIRENEARYRSLFENMLSGFAYHRIVLDENGQPVDYIFLDVNDAFEQQTGLAREDITGKRVTEVIPGIEAYWIERYGQVALTGEPARFEQYAEALDRWYSVSAYSLQNGEFVASFNDITERKQAEEALQASEQRYRTLTENAPIGIWQITPEGYTLYANPAMCSMLQVESYEELWDVHVSAFVSDEDYLKGQREVRKRGSGTVSDYVIELNGREGRKRKVLITGAPIFTPDGELHSSMGLVIDITERVQAEQALQASEMRYRTLAENAPIGIWQLDPEGRAIYANPAMYALAQVDSSEDPTGIHFSEFFSEESLRKVRTEFARRREGAASRYEVEMVGREGRKRRVLVSGAPIFTPDGELHSSMGLIIDITERKRAEEALRQSEARLAAFTGAMPDLGFILDRDGAYLEVLGGQEDLLADRVTRLKGHRIHDVMPPDVADECLAAIQQALATGEVQSVEYSLDVTAGHRQFEGRILPTDTDVIGDDTVAFLARDITERVQAEKAERRHRLLAEALRDTAAALHSTLDLDEVLDRILEATEELVPHRGANILLFDEAHREIRVTKYCGCYDAHGLTKPVIPPPPVIANAFPFAQIVQTRQPMIVADVRESPEWPGPDEVPSIQWIRAYLGAPIIVDGEVTGFINLDSDEVGTYTPADAAVLKALATQAAVAIDSARLYKEAQRTADELEALRRVTINITKQFDLDALLADMMQSVQQLLDVNSAGLYLYRPESDVLEWVASLGETAIAVGSTLKRGEGLSGKVWETGEPLAIQDYAKWEGKPEKYNVDFDSTVVGVPVHWGDEFLGVLDAARHGDASFSFSERNIRLLTLFADQVAIAIRNAQLFDQVEERASDLAALNQASSRVSRWGLDLDGVLQAVVSSLTEEIGLDIARIWLADKEGEMLMMRASAGWDAGAGGDAVPINPADRTGRLEQIAHEGKPFLTNRVREDESFDQEWVSKQGIVAFAGYPLKKDHRLMAVLTIFHSRPLSDTVLDVMGSFVNQAAIAIENARLYEELETYSSILEQAVAERTADLERTKDRVESILHHSPDGIVLLKPDGTVETANPAALEMLGFGVDEIVGQSTMILVDPSDVDRCREVLEATREQRASQRAELLARRKDGTNFDAQAVLGPVVENGSLIGIVCSLRNITALKEIERIKDDFLATAAHELRTPLTSIRGFSELLITRDLSPERQERYHHHINQQSTQLAQIIDDLLDISRLESGRGLDLKLEPVDMGVLIEEVVQPFRETMPEHVFRLDTEEESPVQGDAFRLSQVVRNLVLNAVKYSPDGSEVTIGTRVRDGTLEVSVSDEGIGMTKQQQAHLFEKFYRVDPSGTSGTGLGLVICKLIIEGHGGKIWAESEPGAGSTFTFTVPLVE